MFKNLATCNRCPDAVRLEFQQKKTLSLPNSARVTETAAASAPVSSILGLVGQPNLPQHRSSAGTPLRACVIDSRELSESQTTVQVLTTRTTTITSTTTATTTAKKVSK